MSSNKRRILRHFFTANAGCGCGKPKLSDIFEPEPKPKPKTSNNQNPRMYQSSSSSWDKIGGHSLNDEDHTSTTFSLNVDTSQHCSEPETIPHPSKKMVSSCPKISDSLAVVKDSDDPYLDFRRSMLQMILERDIYSKDDLHELLNCFLQLNSPSHHEIIVQAFMEIWNGVISSTSQQDPSQ